MQLKNFFLDESGYTVVELAVVLAFIFVILLLVALFVLAGILIYRNL